MRECGLCYECCVGLPIQKLKKKEGVPCIYLVDGKCGIYGDHPDVCKKFSCQWLEESPLMEPEWRPDKCGFILWKGKSFGQKLVCLKITRSGVHRSPECREAIMRFGKAYQGKFSVIKKKSS